ncbi:MAG TPA: hypothetical protein VFU55_01720 [Terracidiphilus sp.]|nr:hypothetical protein [Terracidiphilus sp.]
MKRAAIFFSLAIGLCGGMAPAQQPPATMTKMEVLIQSPDLPSSSAGVQSKVLYRAGDLDCRIEEQADPAQGTHGLMIIHEPDAWMVNLANKTALHIVNPGPAYRCRMPIFADRLRDMPVDEQKKVGDLEFGREFVFFTDRGATGKPGPVLQGKQTMLYQLQFGASSLALFTVDTPPIPLAVVWRRGKTHEAFWYSAYTQIPFNASLFAKPSGVIITGAKPGSGTTK